MIVEHILILVLVTALQIIVDGDVKAHGSPIIAL